MKRAFLRKVKLVSCSPGINETQAGESEQTLVGVKRRARTSAAMVGLALSMGATSLLVPRQGDSAGAAETKASQTTPSLHAALPTGSDAVATLAPVEAATHVVQSGQTLQQIARQYQVDIKALAAANALTPASGLQAGQVLKIPSQTVASRSEEAKSSQLLALADLNQVPALAPTSGAATQAQVERDRSLARLDQARTKLEERLAELRRQDTQATKDSKSLIADAAIAENETGSATTANKSSSHIITELPHRTDSSIVPSLAALPSPSVLSQQNGPQETRIAANGPDLDWMQVNRSLDVSGSTAVQPERREVSTGSEVRPAEVATRSTTTLPEAAPNRSIVDVSAETSYQVGPGDTVARIARAHNIPQSTLISANHLSDPNVIFVGQVLRVPGGQTASTNLIQAGSEANKTIPSVLPAAHASEARNLANVTLPTVPTRVNVAQPRTVAIVPSTLQSPSAESAPSLSAPGLSAPEVAPTARTSDSYVRGLLSEVKAMREKRGDQQVADVSQPLTSQEPMAVAAVGTTVRRETIVESRIAPERVTQSITTSAPTVVAAAPLGSESYAPLLEPITGRMVSPDLPSLPDADHFLPDSVIKGYIWPAQGMLSSGYGWRWGRMHQGIDIAADVGTPIHAAASGVIESAGWNSGGYGNMVEIRHPDGSMTRYAHLNAIYVQTGQKVRQGEQIAEMGSTGYSTGPHLHFEVHLADQGTVNPMAYLPAQ